MSDDRYEFEAVCAQVLSGKFPASPEQLRGALERSRTPSGYAPGNGNSYTGDMIARIADVAWQCWQVARG